MDPGQPFGSFIDDYFAESDEHVAGLRRALLALEDSPPDSPVREEHLRAAMRGLHTLKGLAGMVGFAEVEQVAHGLEDWLREAAPAGRLVRGATLDPGFDGAALMEQALTARRDRAEPILPDPFLRRLAESTPRTGPIAPAARGPEQATLTEAEQFRIDEARKAGATLIEFEFIPSSELVARGVGVETVRGRLSALGTLIRAAPRVRPQRGVSFSFLVAVAAGAVIPAEWEADSIRWQAHADPEPEGAAPAESGLDPVTAVRGPSSVVRVDLARLDDLMRMLGELVVTRSRLDEMVSAAARGSGVLSEEVVGQINNALERQLRGLREGVMRVRLVPVGEVFERMRFVVRDLARDSGREVRVQLSGGATEIDKMLVERLMEPLLHLVRNAVSHGLEPAERRAALGKPTAGTLRLSAHTVGERVRIEVGDDGAGIDRAEVVRRARAAGIPVPSGGLPDDDALLAILSAPGFSTRAEADRASGRGVGMDAVREAVSAMAGSLSMTTEPGRGTTFVMDLPLTLMIVDAVLVHVGDQTLAVPQPALVEVVQAEPDEIVAFENNEVLTYRGRPLPLVRLRRIFGIAGREPDRSVVLVVGSAAHPAGVVVDRVSSAREIVVRPLVDPLVTVPGVSGATELGDGRVCLILDAAALGGMAQRQASRRPRKRARPLEPRPGT